MDTRWRYLSTKTLSNKGIGAGWTPSQWIESKRSASSTLSDWPCVHVSRLRTCPALLTPASTSLFSSLDLGSLSRTGSVTEDMSLLSSSKNVVILDVICVGEHPAADDTNHWLRNPGSTMEKIKLPSSGICEAIRDRSGMPIVGMIFSKNSASSFPAVVSVVRLRISSRCMPE